MAYKLISDYFFHPLRHTINYLSPTTHHVFLAHEEDVVELKDTTNAAAAAAGATGSQALAVTSNDAVTSNHAVTSNDAELTTATVTSNAAAWRDFTAVARLKRNLSLAHRSSPLRGGCCHQHLHPKYPTTTLNHIRCPTQNHTRWRTILNLWTTSVGL
ncbi:hypothetical protein LTR08_001709 [Meristemomyces frigidus]|nr:hypothetical protein LTR08_001709 [Meristemomyces frigidus]